MSRQEYTRLNGTAERENERRGTVLCHDDVGVATAVRVDVVHCFLHSTNHFYGALQAAVLRLEGLGTRRPKRQLLCQFWTRVYRHLPPTRTQ